VIYQSLKVMQGYSEKSGCDHCSQKKVTGEQEITEFLVEIFFVDGSVLVVK
jgi:hypothetical protein